MGGPEMEFGFEHKPKPVQPQPETPAEPLAEVPETEPEKVAVF
jgi:hypothetical protein